MYNILLIELPVVTQLYHLCYSTHAHIYHLIFECEYLCLVFLCSKECCSQCRTVYLLAVAVKVLLHWSMSITSAQNDMLSLSSHIHGHSCHALWTCQSHLSCLLSMKRHAFAFSHRHGHSCQALLKQFTIDSTKFMFIFVAQL